MKAITTEALLVPLESWGLQLLRDACVAFDSVLCCALVASYFKGAPPEDGR